MAYLTLKMFLASWQLKCEHKTCDYDELHFMKISFYFICFPLLSYMSGNVIFQPVSPAYVWSLFDCRVENFNFNFVLCKFCSPFSMLGHADRPPYRNYLQIYIKSDVRLRLLLRVEVLKLPAIFVLFAYLQLNQFRKSVLVLCI